MKKPVSNMSLHKCSSGVDFRIGYDDTDEEENEAENKKKYDEIKKKIIQAKIEFKKNRQDTLFDKLVYLCEYFTYF